ncbi:putative OPA3-like protein CG13603 [Chelonus insularis]|uniref:putative OPA3-like protein CG13603 n=1 Tax=Chelonus insularis TaxID=460826 RepID=UPI00158867B8|nr:putative OPA3-like protein CG13603 [Chelonus insularis]XP_034941390.1 putative OPA3-like protein CG13603 [Chelonus insularis]XP_034941391.1 putative OPA3-like protein CG13603 [Chelonus insularis]
MAVGAYPLVKLGILFLKQVSKPVAKVLVEQAKNHPVFRTYVIVPLAQMYHWAEVKTKMYVMNLGKPTKVAKLNEQMAIELGANFMGEIIIFTITGGLIIFEVRRSAAKEAKKEAAREAQLIKFTEDIQALFEASVQQEKQLKQLTSVIEELAKKTKSKIDVEKLKQLAEPIHNNGRDILDNNSDKNQNNDNNNNRSVVNRAIDYYEKDVKGSKLS